MSKINIDVNTHSNSRFRPSHHRARHENTICIMKNLSKNAHFLKKKMYANRLKKSDEKYRSYDWEEGRELVSTRVASIVPNSTIGLQSCGKYLSFLCVKWTCHAIL